jgi:hypothetical protein
MSLKRAVVRYIVYPQPENGLFSEFGQKNNRIFFGVCPKLYLYDGPIKRPEDT